MSRTIRFRAWDKRNKKMLAPLSGILWGQAVVPTNYVWALFDYETPDNYSSIFEGEMMEVNDVELMEYIGRLDHHDKEMCEGDIVEYIDNTSRGLVKKIAVINDIRHLPDFSCSKWEEIIGNICENPDLVQNE